VLVLGQQSNDPLWAPDEATRAALRRFWIEGVGHPLDRLLEGDDAARAALQRLGRVGADVDEVLYALRTLYLFDSRPPFDCEGARRLAQRFEDLERDARAFDKQSWVGLIQAIDFPNGKSPLWFLAWGYRWAADISDGRRPPVMVASVVKNLAAYVRERTGAPRYSDLEELLGLAAPATFGPEPTYESVRLWIHRHANRNQTGATDGIPTAPE
jgi:hypothetical protein